LLSIAVRDGVGVGVALDIAACWSLRRLNSCTVGQVPASGDGKLEDLYMMNVDEHSVSKKDTLQE
jgi:hypothetical protein